MEKLKNLEKNLKVKFKNIKFLKLALVHRSFLNETREKELSSNERMEFLGDAVLEFIISDTLFRQFPDYPEGILTNLRSNIVRTTTLAVIAQNLELGKYLMLSRGEKEANGAQNTSILADTLEAVIGAIYLDQGIKAAGTFVKEHFAPTIEEIIAKGEFKDAKSKFQETSQARTKLTPTYQTIKESGPDHNKLFTVGVYLGHRLIAKGQGKSKQSAEEMAAKNALKKPLSP